MSRMSPQLICFSYHKSGTSLLLHVMTKVSEKLGLTLANHYGLIEKLDPEPDVLLLPHSLLRAPLDWPYRAIRLIRDPRDIWVSGYLYHLRCEEEWCRGTDFDPTPPIRWPQVDYSFAHWPEDWKQHYLDRLGGRSYQQNLLDRSLADGLAFELEGYTGCTLATMREWHLNRADMLDIKLEDVMADFDSAMLRIFHHFGFTEDQQQAALEVARSEDVGGMDDAAIAARPQIHSRKISKWRDVLSPAQVATFEKCHGDLIHELGYETTADFANWFETGDAVKTVPSRPAYRMAAGTTFTRVIEIWLSADGLAIRPTVADNGTYGFVVPSARRRVRLESRFAMPNDTRRLGVKVTAITICSGAGEAVIAIDDPSLAPGWCETEHAGLRPGRWTDGSAEIPWSAVSGPAIVTIHCTPFGGRE